jgi:hypothetical protein
MTIPPFESLADIDAARRVVGDQRPAEVGGFVAGADATDRGAVDAAALEDADSDVGAGEAGSRPLAAMKLPS